MKHYIVSEFRQAANLLGRHSGFASSYRDPVTGRRIVEIVEEVERGPDTGIAKETFAWAFRRMSARLALAVVLPIGIYAGLTSLTGEPLGMAKVALVGIVGSLSAILARLLADRFAGERATLTAAFDAVERFRGDALALARILGFEDGTAKDIIDRRFLGRAMKIVSFERADEAEKPQMPGVAVERGALYSELSLVRKFMLGKALQGYFDRARIEVDNLARRGAAANN